MLASENIRRVEFHGTIDAISSNFSLSGEVEGMQVSPELHESLPGPLADKLAALRALRAEVQLTSAWLTTRKPTCRCDSKSPGS